MIGNNHRQPTLAAAPIGGAGSAHVPMATSAASSSSAASAAREIPEVAQRSRRRAGARSPRALSVLMFGLVLFGISGAALAMDGYHDRRGLFVGAHATGAGVFGINEENAGGFGLGLALGGGASDWVTLGLLVDLYYFPSDRVLEPVVIRPAAQVQMFFPSGLFVDLSAGLSYWSYQSAPDLPNADDNDMGFSAAAGLGYEFWVGASYALQLTAAYDFTYLPDLEDPSHLIVARLGFRWY
jgi:hypothetical protein